jgi:hypothetical protein
VLNKSLGQIEETGLVEDGHNSNTLMSHGEVVS